MKSAAFFNLKRRSIRGLAEVGMPWEGAVSNREHVIDEGEHGGGN